MQQKAKNKKQKQNKTTTKKVDRDDAREINYIMNIFKRKASRTTDNTWIDSSDL